MINMVIKVKFGIGVHNTIFSEALLETEQANFFLIQKYLSLVHIIFMATTLKHQQILNGKLPFLKKKLVRKWKKKILNLTAFRKSLRNS